MSVQSDLARNRKVFERLMAGVEIPRKNIDEQSILEVDSFDESKTTTLDDLSDRPPADYAVKTPARVERLEQAPARYAENYSLQYGTRRQTGMALEFKAPGGPEYPETREADLAPAPNLLENLYYQIGVEARMSSQLLSEEEL